jgi:hypothetical protein
MLNHNQQYACLKEHTKKKVMNMKGKIFAVCWQLIKADRLACKEWTV